VKTLSFAFALLLSSYAQAAGVDAGGQPSGLVPPDAGPAVAVAIAASPTLNSTRLVRDSRKLRLKPWCCQQWIFVRAIVCCAVRFALNRGQSPIRIQEAPVT